MNKRVICLLLTISLIVLLCGCKNTYAPFTETHIPVELKEIVFKTEFEQYPCDVKTIKYSKTNINDENIYVGDGASGLLMLRENEWQIVVGKKDIEVIYIAHRLEPGDTITWELNIEEYYYLPLEPGFYRLYDGTYQSETFEIVE